MFHSDILTTLREACIEQECYTLEFETYSMHVSCVIMNHILDCEDKGTEPNIMELKVPDYPFCTGECTRRIGDCFTI